MMMAKKVKEKITGTSAYVTFDNLDPNNGAGKVCIHEITALAKASNLTQVLCRGGTGGVLEGKPVKTVNIDKAYGFNPYLYDYFMADNFVVPPAGIDLLHLSCSPGVALLNKLRPKKYVCNVVAHDLKTSIEEHERITGQKYPFVHNVDPYLHSVLLKHAEGANCVLCPSSSSKRWIEENVKPKRVELIPHGCDFPDNAPELPLDKLRLGYFGAIGPDKGLVYLLIALNQLKLKNFELVFAGPQCEEAKLWVSQFCPSVPTRYLGFVKTSLDFFKEVNIVCAPSVSEGFGLVVIEGPAHGRGVLSTTGTGAVDVLNKNSALIVPPRDPVALAEKIQYLHDNLDVIKKMGKEARRRAAKFKWSLIEERYVKLYQELLNE
jgi:glycosyltransferase involved in cell wall biosynthesis